MTACSTPPTPLGPTGAEAVAAIMPQPWWEVATPPAEAARACRELLPRTGVLEVDELERLVARVAADRDLWEPLVVVDPARRRYRLLYEDEHVDVWVLSWMPGQATGFHDHDLSSVGLACARGAVRERQMLLPSGATSLVMDAGSSRRGGPGYIHSVAHEGGEPAVTIHAYSPPLERVGQYRVDEQGVLRRSIEHGRKELLDNTIATLDPSRA